MIKIHEQEISKQNLTRILKTTGPHGSYLFSGSEGVGKQKTALFFARAANCLDHTPHIDNGCKCEICVESQQVFINHPDIFLFENVSQPVEIDRLTLFKKFNITHEDHYFNACDFLHENNLISQPVRRFNADQPVDFFYRNPALVMDKIDKLTEMYSKLSESGETEPYNIVAARIIHDYFLANSRGFYRDSIKLKHIHSMIKQTIILSPLQLRYKFYILNDAHLLTDEAQNALLKILEEPPSHNVFILVSSLPHNLFPTILSRVNKIYFHPVSRNVIENELIQKRGQARNRAGVIASYFRGNLTAAMRVVDDEFFKERSRIFQTVEYLTSGKKYFWSNATRIFTDWEGYSQRIRTPVFINRLHMLSSVFQDLCIIILELPRRRIHNDVEKEFFSGILKRFTLDQIIEIIHWIEKSLVEIEINQDALLTIEKLFIKITGKQNQCAD